MEEMKKPERACEKKKQKKKPEVLGKKDVNEKEEEREKALEPN